MAIKILSSNMINRIAAGEVIERPASAIKELIENSLDANATKIDITIEHGGQNFIKISDNGNGMSKEDLKLAVERHATSKLPDNDLLNINYFGFRGEALASIGAVGRLKISSKEKDSDQAWQVSIDGGENKTIAPTSISYGTEIELKDLFFATPARLKFLKTERTEQNHISDTIQKIAMANPEVSFKLKSNGKEVLNYNVDQLLSPEENIKNRLNQIIGKDFMENAISLEGNREYANISGYASLPTYNRSTNSGQYLFVNGRPVKDKLIYGAVRGAYQDFLASNRHPAVVVFLELPNETVDINVHPAKSEVRFRDSNLIRGMIVSTLKHAIANAGHRASTTVAEQAVGSFFDPSSVASFPNTNPTSPPSTFHNNYSSGYRSTSSSGMAEAQQAFAPAGNLFEQENLGLSVNAELPKKNDVELQNNPLGSARCQLHETYIVAQTADGMILVDQHAAHERLVYEGMKKQMAENSVKTQMLLIPEVVELSAQQYSHIMESKNTLGKLGIEVESFGDSSVLIRETPSLLGEIDTKKLIIDLADELIEVGEPLSLNNAIEHVGGTIACHHSIRAGRILKIDEMNALLRQMEQTPHSGQCNHGRPTYVKLKQKDIEKLFGRR